MEFRIETERLYIRELLQDDDEGMFEMDRDPEVHRYIAQAPVKTIEETREVIAFIQKQYAEHGIGRWAVIEKKSGNFIGWTGFKLMKEYANGRINHYDFGYRLTRSAWGQGIATEAARASLQYGIAQLKLTPVFAMTDVDNTASRNVLEKIGFRFVEIFNYERPPDWRTPGALVPVTWYEI
jgi:RimJ/RimL family protein N-acetyltransferase